MNKINKNLVTNEGGLELMCRDVAVVVVVVVDDDAVVVAVVVVVVPGHVTGDAGVQDLTQNWLRQHLGPAWSG